MSHATWKILAAAAWAMSFAMVANVRAQSGAEWIYTIKPGDNPWRITELWLEGMKYWPLLQKHNGIVDPLNIPPGTKLRVPIAWLKTESAKAVVRAATSQGCSLRSTPDRALSAGDPLAVGVEIFTSATGTCSIEFADASRVLLLADSQASLDRMVSYTATGMYDIAVRLLRGRAQSQVTPASGPASRFEISSPQGVTSVRGTRYRVASSEADGRAEVLEGNVDVGNAHGKVSLATGAGTVFRQESPPLEPVMLLPAPDLSSLPARTPNRPRSLRFTEISGAKSYRHQIAKDAEFSTLVFDAFAAAPSLNLPALAPGDYFLHSRAIDANGLEGRDALHQFRVFEQLPAADQCTPAKDRVSASQAVLRCEVIAHAAYYRFQVSRDAEFKQIEADWIESAPVHTFTAKRTGEHFWRMAAIDHTGGEGEFSQPFHFTRRVEAPAVDLAELGRQSLTFGWRAFDTGHRYRLQLATDPEFKNLLRDSVTMGDRLVVPRPDQGLHYVRVAVAEPDSEDFSYGAARAFNIPPLRPLEWLGPVGLILLFAL